MLADVIIFVYEVPCIFWHYINVDKVSLITLQKVLQSAMELLQIATAYFITKCDGQLSQIATAFLLQSAMDLLQIVTGITKCDDYYKLRQYRGGSVISVPKGGGGSCVFYQPYFQSKFDYSPKGITKCDGIITNCDSLVYYKVRWTVITNCDSFFITKCDTVYYKLRQVLQSAMDLLQIATVYTSLMLPSVCVIGVHGSIAFYRMRSRDLSSELKERS